MRLDVQLLKIPQNLAFNVRYEPLVSSRLRRTKLLGPTDPDIAVDKKSGSTLYSACLICPGHEA